MTWVGSNDLQDNHTVTDLVMHLFFVCIQNVSLTVFFYSMNCKKCEVKPKDGKGNGEGKEDDKGKGEEDGMEQMNINKMMNKCELHHFQG